MEIRFALGQNLISGKSLASKLDVPIDVLKWHVEKAAKNKVIVQDTDFAKIGWGYYYTLEAVLWIANELNIDDFRLVAEIIREMVGSADTDKISRLRNLIVEQADIVDSILGKKPEPSKMEEKEDDSQPFNTEQKAYWDEVQSVLDSVSKQTGDSKRKIVKAVCERLNKDYGIVWYQLKKDVMKDLDLSKEWAIDGRGMTNIQAITYSTEQNRSIFKSVLFDYPKWSIKKAG